MEVENERIKQLIRTYFAKIKPEHQQKVIERLRQIRNNADKLEYLRGWTKLP